MSLSKWTALDGILRAQGMPDLLVVAEIIVLLSYHFLGDPCYCLLISADLLHSFFFGKSSCLFTLSIQSWLIFVFLYNKFIELLYELFVGQPLL